MANAIPDSWGPICLVNVWDGTTMFDIEALTDTIDFDLGDKEWEFRTNAAGGRVGKQIPEADTVITFEGWFRGIGDADTTVPKGLLNRFYAGTDAAAPFSVNNWAQPQMIMLKWNLFFLWSDDSTVGEATAAIVSGANALRFRFDNARLVSIKPSFTDDELKFTWKFRVPARSKAGLKTITMESTDGTAAMTTLTTI